MKKFKFFNNLTGWVVFAIASITYLMTIEPTASFWDCGEFISTADKLEVGHPPGAPFFMLTARFFTLFASDQSMVAMMVNAFSAICSGFCILFLFWTITHLSRRLVVNRDEEISLGQMLGILGAGVVGALAYTFSDTFWFSAVEGEVYAYSSLFTAIVFWAMLKWEDVADEPYANRWLVFIMYMMGLSVGVHLLNLLTIPVLVLVYYYKKYTPTTKGTIATLLISCIILAVILFGIVPGFVGVAGWFELFFVNVLGTSFNFGTLIYALLLISCLIWGLVESSSARQQKKQISGSKGVSSSSVDAKQSVRMRLAFLLSFVLLGIPFFGGHIILGIILIAILAILLFAKQEYFPASFLNLIMLCCTVFIIGYSSYAAIIIRSAANTPMDQNSPDDVFALKSYLNRDQYGDTPLLYGETYASEVARVRTDNGYEADIDEGENLYAKKIKADPNEPDQYVAYDTKKSYNYLLTMPFPRMYSKQPHHVSAYKTWGNIKGKKVTYSNMGSQHTKVVPTFGENLRYFFSYQVGFMYWRYFMWNFAGRQNDIQGNGEVSNGNWISGIPFIDNMLVGDQSQLPDEMKNNKGRNTYYFLPLILGILGILYQFSRKEKGMQSFWMTFILFFMTGLAIVLYLNQTPYQPRERDYAYVGSFYAFAIWIGLGVLYLKQLLDKVLDSRLASVIAIIVCLPIPALMAHENWDDHDRSKRYTARDFGQNYLLSLRPNAVIFTNGDNDTFPLWYNQEVEGVGADARVANLSYLQMGWYVDQMKRQAYQSEPLPLSLTPAQYMNGNLDVAYVTDIVKSPIDVKTAMTVLTNKEKYSRLQHFAEDVEFIPSNRLYIEVDSAAAVNSGTVALEDAHLIADKIDINLSSKNYLGKHEIFILDLLQNNNWERPLYFAVTVGSDSYLGLRDYWVLEGMAFRVTPVKRNPLLSSERVNTEVMYDNMLHKFKWGGIAENPDIYMDENNLRMTSTLRYMFVRLVDALQMEATQATMKKDYSEVVAWALANGNMAINDTRNMSLYRKFSAAYYANESVMESSYYSDSMLIAQARPIAIELLGRKSSADNRELALILKDYASQINDAESEKIAADKNAKAIEVLDFADKVMPEKQIPYTAASMMMAKQYMSLNQKEKAEVIMQKMRKTSIQYLDWISYLSRDEQKSASNDFTQQFSIFSELIRLQQDIKGADDVDKDDIALYSKYRDLYYRMK